MSFTVAKSLAFPQKSLNYTCSNDSNTAIETGLFSIGGILSDTRHAWQAKGPYLEIRDTKRGSKVGSWTFGCILKDSNTKIVDVKELQKSSGKLALLAVGLNCTISGGFVCLFNIFSSKVIRAIQIKEKVSSLCVVDSGVEVLNLPGPLHDFDGILAIGTEEGNVLLIDICRQICEESLMSFTIRDELLPCQLALLTPEDVPRIDYYRERAVRKGKHLAIHLNVVLDSNTEHFTLKGPKGEDRIHVNREEVCTSTLYYCNQLTSLLVGFNFGAFQLWDLTSLKLIYTSPVCDEHIPITHFALQEPTDDPRAFCYIWVSYSNLELYETGLPFAVMYAVCYESKEYHEGYGYLYQNFQYCAIRFQVELGSLEDRSDKLAKGGVCLHLQAVSKFPTSKDSGVHISTGDTLALCVISWTIYHEKNKTQSNALIFDLNQWYKEQMPTFSKWSKCNNFILRMNLTDLIAPHKQKISPLLDVKMDESSLRQFVGVQRLEEHFSPTSLTFDIWLLKENEVFSIHSEGLQKALLHQIQNEGPLCLLRPNEIFQRLVSLGLTPVFADVALNLQVTADIQRETILNVALEHHMLNWLCKSASEWANGRFSSAGCTIDFLLKWAFQRAVVLKTNCDKFCAPLFDYSQSRLDNNTSILLNSCTGQINVLYKFYNYIINHLSQFISYIDLAEEQKNSLEMVATYFEVLQWLLNVGLLPECHPSSYPRPDITERISAPYPVKQLIEYYSEKRAQLQLLSKEQFASSDSLLFIDNLINHKCGAEVLQAQWQEDGGSGLYPPPSLQSLLRTYLIPNASICHKHSLVIYLFLDLAMALDQRKYSPVVTYLIKFPAVFKVSPSMIKITQAFWQLDHGDHNTAIEQLLDPFVLKEDLQPWHHNIAMRSLLLQNQHKAALRYMQVRRPPMTDDASILTAISLYITNNMVTEAFYFMKEHCHTDEDKFLMHLFNECNKNKSLHVLLYKCLNDSEERAFLKYLTNIEQPNLKDLQVFYFLLRSRFLEAFDAHARTRKKDPDTKGLIGQRNATHTDQIVRIFKNCLPDVNRNLVEYIRKEKNNLWKEVPRPTPLSVFVHDTKEKIQYKSTVIHAAISKAKNTFHDTANSTRINEIFTEETPFLRTPTAFRNPKRHNTPIITPKVILMDEDGEEMGPSPPKRLKLSPRVSAVSPSRILPDTRLIHSKMLTPIVKRKTSLEHRQTPDDKYRLNVCTPLSILKVRNLVRHGDSLEESAMDDEDEYDLRARASSPSRPNYSIQSRRSLSRSRQHVQFEDAGRFSSPFSDQPLPSKPVDDTTFDEKLLHTSNDTNTTVSSKNSTNTTEEFYSPNASIGEKSETEKDNQKKLEVENDSKLDDIVAEKIQTKIDIDEDIDQKLAQSPRARRSYKRSLGEMSPVRSSPRLSRNISKLVTKSESAIDESRNQTDDAKRVSILTSKSENEIEGTPPVTEELNVSSNSTGSDSPFIRSPRLLQRVKGRKSLSRKVLEHNSLLRLQGSPHLKETTFSQTEKTSIVEKSAVSLKTTTLMSSVNIKDYETAEKESPCSERKRQSNSSVSMRKSSMYSPGVLDTSGSDYSMHYEEDPLFHDLKFSDSMEEFITSLRNKTNDHKINETSTNEKSTESQCTIEEVYKQTETLREKIEEETKHTREEILRQEKKASNKQEKHASEDGQEETDNNIVEIPNKSSSIIETPSESKSPLVTYSSSTPISNRRTSRFSTVHDTSNESEYNYRYEPSPSIDEVKFSDSIVEYINSLKNKKNVTKTHDNSGNIKSNKEEHSTFEEKKVEATQKNASNSGEAELSEEDDDTENFRKQVYEDFSSGTEEVEEVLKDRESKEAQSEPTIQLDVRMESQEVISLDSSEESEEKETSESSEDEERSLDQALVSKDQVGTPNSEKEDGEVIEIESSDTEAATTEKSSAAKNKCVEERHEVSLYSHLEVSTSSEEDFSLVYRDLDDETQAATQALEAEMNEPTYALADASNDVFEALYIEKEVTVQNDAPEERSQQIEQENKEVRAVPKEDKEFKESGISVSFEDSERRLPEKQNKNNEKGGLSKHNKETEEETKMEVGEEELTKKANSENNDQIVGKETNSEFQNEVTKTIAESEKCEEEPKVKTIHENRNLEEKGTSSEKSIEVSTKEPKQNEQANEVEEKSKIENMCTKSDSNQEDSSKTVISEHNKIDDSNSEKSIATISEKSRLISHRENVKTEQTLEEQNELGKKVDKGKNIKHKTDSSTNTTHFTLEDKVAEMDTEGSISSATPTEQLKKDESTNTTILTGKNTKYANKLKNRTGDPKIAKSYSRERSKLKTEETTATTENDCSASSETNKGSDKEVQQDSFITSVEKLDVRKVYKPKTSKKTSVEDQNTSSSDTTEGDSVGHDIVVTAQVHTPVRKKLEEPLIKRMTRRRSQLFSQDEKIENIKEEDGKVALDVSEKKEGSSIDLQDMSSGQDDTTLPGRRTRRALSSNSTERQPIRTRRSSLSGITKSEGIDCTLNTSKEILQDPKAVKLLKRTRSSSVDEVKTYSRKRSLRSTSIHEQDETANKSEKEEEPAKPKSRTKALSVSHMPVISEETRPKPKKRSRAGSALEIYTTSRRLTRRQADIIKGIPTPTDVTAEDDSEVEEQVDLDVFDPINLLDKEPFKGDPDPEEQKVYEQSSPSTGSVSSFTKPRRVSRSASMASDVTEKPPSETSPKKRRSVARSQTESPKKTNVRTRSRQQSETGSAISEKSEQVTPPKRSKNKHDDKDEVASNVSASSRTTRRSRTSSIKSEGSPTSTTKKTGRKKVVSSKKHDLPKIAEEKINDSVSSTDSKERKGTRDGRTRSKK